MWCSPGASASSCTPVPPSTRETSSRRATSAMIVRSPRRAAASPRAAATVDFPTPPLPVTTRSGLSSRPAAAARRAAGAAVSAIGPVVQLALPVVVDRLEAHERLGDPRLLRPRVEDDLVRD